MRRLSPSGLALAGALLLTLTPSAAAHTGAGAVDRTEAAAIGQAHAEEHAMARVMDAQRRQQPEALSAPQREQRLEASSRATQRLNAALGNRADVGYWEPALVPLPEWAINSVMLPTGKVLMWGRELSGANGTQNRGSARLFDPVTGATQHVPPPNIPQNLDGSGNQMAAPLFCAGQTFLSDGRVLLAGGNLRNPAPPGRPEYSGLDYTLIFDPWNEANPWEIGPRMTHGRWYPTLTRLSSGDVLIAAGLDENGQGSRNGWLDIWRPGENPTPLTPLVPYPAGERSDPAETTTPNLDPDARYGLSLYPMMQLLPDGDVALAGPGQQDSAILDASGNLEDPGRTAAPGSAWTQVGKGGPLPGQLVAGTVPSVIHQGGMPLLDPDLQAFGGSWQLLAMAGAELPAAPPGGLPPGANPRTYYKPARPTVDRFDATPSVRAWTHDTQEDLNQSRLYANSVLLPDGGIVVVGGGLGAWPQPPGLYYVGENEAGGPPAQLKHVELRRPGERSWRLGAAQQEFRTYHSSAWLLPDGRIVSAGDDGRAKLIASKDDAEVYWPPNLFDGDSCALRPAIRGVGAADLPPPSARESATLTYGEQLGIFSEHAQPGMQAVLVAPAAVTHSNDMNQRVVPLRVDATVAEGGLNVTMPATPTIAPPGYYMLFVVGADGTPSQARWVHVLPAQAAVAKRGDAAPALVTGVRPGAKGRVCTNPDGTRRSEPDPPGPAPAPDPGPAPAPARAAKLPAKLALARAAIDRRNRRLDVFAPISARASGRVSVDLFSAGRHTRLTTPIDSRRRRILVKRRIPAKQAVLGTGILTLTYRGNAATFPQTVRLRAAPGKANLTARRPMLTAGGRLRASGTIRGAARGVVRIELQFGVGAEVRTLQYSARIERGRWSLNRQLTRTARAAIGARSGTVHSTVLFTGYAPARMRGEMRSYQLLAAP